MHEFAPIDDDLTIGFEDILCFLCLGYASCFILTYWVMGMEIILFGVELVIHAYFGGPAPMHFVDRLAQAVAGIGLHIVMNLH